MALPKGTQAPAFTLNTKNADGLAEVAFKPGKESGKTVLLFFPFAFTGVCTDEMCSVSAGLSDYEGLNAKVYGISVDSPFAQEGWALQNDITIPLLSDLNREVAKAYDVLYEDFIGYQGIAKRSAFVVGGDGRIAFAWSSDDPKQLPPFDEIKQALQS